MNGQRQSLSTQSKREEVDMTARSDSLGNVSTRFLLCRMLRHPWEPEITILTKAKGRPAYETTWVCGRCGTRKQEVWGAKRGQLVVRSPYEYPEGYRLEAGVRGNTTIKSFNAEVRLELFDRLASNGHGRRRLKAVK